MQSFFAGLNVRLTTLLLLGLILVPERALRKAEFMQDNAIWPSEIRLNPEKNELTVSFGDEGSYAFSAEFLRVLSPSAEVQGHSPDQRVTVPGKIGVLVKAIEPIGNYAIRIVFDDGHDTGLYSWEYLHELGTEQDERWQQYLDELKEKGLTRER